MAPAPFGGYRGHDSRSRGFHVDGLTTNDYYHDRRCNKDCQQIQMCHLLKDVIKRDVKERDPSDVNSRTKRDSRTVAEREPGELSSESSSVIEDGFENLEVEDEASSRKKRKLSPSMRDLEEKKENNFLHTKTRDLTWAQSPLSLSGLVARVSHKHTSVKRVDKLDLLTEKECGEVRGISLSRWADVNYLVEHDEDAISAVNCLARRRENIPLIFSQDRSSDGGEVIVGEGSERSTSNVSGSGELFHEASPEIMEGNHRSIETDIEVDDCSFRTLKSVQPPCKGINMLQCCRSVDDFEKLNKINEGTYGIVYRARDKKSGEIVALKKVKMEKEREGFPLTALREINILLSLHHPSIVEVKEVVVGSDLDGIFTVMEYMEHDLKGLMERMNKPFHMSEIKCLMLQLLSGVKHLHDNWVLHRDLKASNILFNNHGEVKICDFGLSRQYGSPLKPYTQLVVTLWYRAPELLLGAKEYSTAIDMWSLGCIMAEFLTKEPLFSGKSELDQLDKIFRVLGTPDEKIWPGFARLPGAKVNFSKKAFKLHEKFPRMSFTSFLGRPLLSDAGFDLLSKLFTYDPEKRITAEEALNHPWFLESPLPTSKEFMPTFPVQHTQDRQRR
ncbi:Cyclin-dependent kinase G-1 [Platanthera guangdongensis]|uniref:Cyclin-dependent kinase G-1 n=1 Tax=Platanthera guangdongensis TaxID=2320717 RepID=A0ABR2LD33_9ASPA